MLDFILAISHHLLIFILFGVLVAELILVRSSLDEQTITRSAHRSLVWNNRRHDRRGGIRQSDLRRERLELL